MVMFFLSFLQTKVVRGILNYTFKILINAEYEIIQLKHYLELDLVAKNEHMKVSYGKSGNLQGTVHEGC